MFNILGCLEATCNAKLEKYKQVRYYGRQDEQDKLIVEMKKAQYFDLQSLCLQLTDKSFNLKKLITLKKRFLR